MMKKLFQTQCLPSFFIIGFCVNTLLTGCNNDSYVGPEGYNMKKPVEREMGKVLTEISGINFNNDSSSLLAISDNKEKIFEINLKTQKLRDFTKDFYAKNDFEDLVKVKDTVYVLISNGTIVAVPEGAKDSSNAVAYPFWSTDKNDFEALYYDEDANGLIMLCKSCEHEKGKDVRTAYRFDLSGKKFDSTEFYTISSERIKEILKTEDVEFKPSAAAIHPVEKRLYILASAGQLFVIANTKGEVQEVYPLNPDKHPQAEGIAFSPNGTLFISNEGKYGKATLQVYQYNKGGAANKTKKEQ